MRKIIPYFWCDGNLEEFISFYTGVFPNSKTGFTTYSSEASAAVSGIPVGTIMSQQFWLCGQEFGAINGGDYFKHSPAVSMTVPCENKEQIDALWEKISEGGFVMMPLQEYPFSPRYGWVQDRFGVSWQLHMSGEKHRLIPSLLFVNEKCGKAQQAVEDYARIFKGSKITAMDRFSETGPDPKGDKLRATLQIGDTELVLMDGAGVHQFDFTGAISLMVDCENQQEIDYFWNAFTKEGDELPCGWAKDKYGVTWQVFANFLEEYLYDNKNADKSEAALQAMYGMKKISIDGIVRAHSGA